MMKRLLSALLMAAICATTWAQSPRYIFYFIGDGMGMGHVWASEMYNRTQGADSPMLMMQFPVASQATTYSWSSPVTDSAAAGTALASGVKTRNNMSGMSPDTTAVFSVATKLKALGWGVGVISSNAPDDATPAAFYAHQPSRSMYYEIGLDAVASGFDVLGGAPMRGMTDKDGNRTDLRNRFEEAGVQVIDSFEGIDPRPGSRFLFSNPVGELKNTLGYTIDSVAGTTTLPVLTAETLGILEQTSPERFFMMVENGMTDWSAHANDAGTLVREVATLNDAIAVAYDFYLAHPEETLIIVTADHDTGGLTLGNANPAIKYDAHPELLALQRLSKEAFAAKVGAMMRDRRMYTWAEMKEVLSRDFGFWSGVAVTPDEELALHALFDKMQSGEGGEGQETLYATFDEFTAEVFRVMDAHTGMGWVSTYHTGNMVPVYAVGVGSECFTRLTDNTQIPLTLLDLVTNPNSPRQ